MRVWFEVYSGYGCAVRTAARELRKRMPERHVLTDDWRTADLTVDLTVDSPIGTLGNVPRERDQPQHDWHREMLERLTSPQRKVVFPICCFEGSEVLRYACREAAVTFSFLPDFAERLGEQPTNLVLTSLGVDPRVFTPGPPWSDRPYDIYTWGYIAETEFIHRIHQACALAGRRQLHSGKDFGYDRDIAEFVAPAADGDAVAERYRQCRYANAMRAPYGFELAALEATLCGARAICLDLPCYRHWFGDLVRYVKPGERESEQIALILDEGDDMPDASERRDVANRFNWDRVAEKFWRAIEAAA